MSVGLYVHPLRYLLVTTVYHLSLASKTIRSVTWQIVDQKSVILPMSKQVPHT